ncbi:copper resistance CopC/CopD family protein [Rhodopseudomonas palustris]|uniref:copper resistance CopC/CopD family protein n=1 Tax=Rhodopseudomonas palustris TaxID=1076 RepID=UPI001F21A586|nr:CopD family protein [Rhodopseudomonas palustris]
MIAVAAVLLLPALAHAHAGLVSSDPAAEAVLATAPATLSLTFNEPVEPLALSLIDAQGNSHPITEIARDGASLRFAPPSALSTGGHVLSWRVVSGDGHPIGGSLTFWIGAPGSALPAIIVRDDPARRTAIWLTGVFVELTLFTAVGGAVFAAWIAAAPLAGVGLVSAGLALLGLAALIGSVGLQGLDALDLPLRHIRDVAVWRAGGTGSFGDAATLTGLAFVLALAALRWRGWNARWPSLGAVVSLGTAFAVSGHAATAEPRMVASAAIWVHGASLALWIGALLPLAMGVSRQAGPQALRRFSRAIPVAIAALLISGIVLSVLQLGRVEALWSSGYGRILIAKLALVTLLLLIALWNRARLTPRLEAGTAGAVQMLRRTIAAELVLVVAILGVVGLWRFTPPPHNAASGVGASASASAFVHLHGEKAMAGVTLMPDRAGPIEFSVVLQTPDEAPLAAQALTVTLANPAAGIEPASAEAQRQPDGAWRARMPAPLPGSWTLTLGILISDFEKVSIEGPVVIR